MDKKKRKSFLLPLKIDPDNEYEREMLSRRVKYVRIIKKPGKIVCDGMLS